jgi:hypothetical protein
MATQVMPALGNAGVTETMSVSRTAQTQGTMGGVGQGSTTTPYTNIPVSVEPDSKSGRRVDLQGKPIALPTNILVFAKLTSAGALIDINIATDKFIVNPRPPLPARTFKIDLPIANSVMNQFVCTEVS